MTQLCVILPRGSWELWVYEFADCNPDERRFRTFIHGRDAPEQGGTACRAEVVVDRMIRSSADTVGFWTVVDRKLTFDFYALTLRKIRLDSKNAARALLAEVAVARTDKERLAAHSDSY
jgi:hypothetical protein